MASLEDFDRLKEGRQVWNDWRKGLSIAKFADLRNANLQRMSLSGYDLSDADLTGANLSSAILASSNLAFAKLHAANLSGADLQDANLYSAGLYRANLVSACLVRAVLSDANIAEANLFNANLMNATLAGADFRRALLNKANLFYAVLSNADMWGANLDNANLAESNLTFAAFRRTTLSNTNFAGASLGQTLFAEVDLSSAKGLETCSHKAASVIDYDTLKKSGALPTVFLQGLGLPEIFMEYLPSLLQQPIQFYTCFISYSSIDQDFASRLHADLQSQGVRCWFAKHDMRIGAKIRDEIDFAIRLREKLIIILSKKSIASDWVEEEVTKALEEEHIRKRTVLFPIRLDDSVLTTKEPWAATLRSRHIGDFTRWKEHDEFKKSFAIVLRDLAVKVP